MTDIISIASGLQGHLVQITEGRFVYTFLHNDKLGRYIYAIPNNGDGTRYMLASKQDKEAGKVLPPAEKPSRTFFDFTATILAEHWSQPILKDRGFKWDPKHGYMWCRYEDSELFKLKLENQQLEAYVLRLKQELGRVPTPRVQMEVTPKPQTKGNQ